MKIQTPPGMRDFYPEEMRLHNWLMDHWRGASRTFGFSEYEGPIFEFLDLYTLKSGDEIVSQLFNFEDRGGRRFAIRPEMTPTLARMVAARANALPRPIKWFSTPRMCRAEKPQRGRLREFFQWNADILGPDDPLADAEVIALAVNFLRRIGLTENEVVIRTSSRPLVSSLFATIGIAPENFGRAFELLDRRERMPAEAFEKAWTDALGQSTPAEKVIELLHGQSFESICTLAEQAGPDGLRAAEHMSAFRDALRQFGAWPYCELDLSVVRGLAYYTGIVFEIHPRNVALRALLGGGRYDDLVGMLGGPPLTGVGFGMGDVPVIELLTELGKLPELKPTLDFFVIDADATLLTKVLEIVACLRNADYSADFSYKRAALGKQLRTASTRNARYVVIVGVELAEKQEIGLKEMTSGRQEGVDAASFLADPRAVLSGMRWDGNLSEPRP